MGCKCGGNCKGKVKRGFKVVKDEIRRYPGLEITMPKRGSKTSAGYDFFSPINEIIPAHGTAKIPTGVKVFMQQDEVLMIYPRSSIGFKKKLMLVNTTGIIDSDYYENPNNDGNIGFAFYNMSDVDVLIKAGERVLQGIFVKYLITEDDDADEVRTGGTGSTGDR